MTHASRHFRIVRRPAFTIIEMLVVVILLGTLASLLAQLFVVSFKAMRDSQKYEEMLFRVDSAVHTLRRDAWCAPSVNLDGQRLEIALPSGGRAVWRYLPDGTLTRTDGQIAQSWKGLPPMTFSAGGPLLTLRLHAAPGREESLTLISQRMAAGGAP